MAFIPSAGGSGGSSLVRNGFAGRAKRRACYVYVSNESNGYDFVFLDQDFNSILPMYYNYSSTNYIDAANTHFYHSGTFQSQSSTGFSNWQNSGSYPSSSSNVYVSMNGLNGSNGCAAVHLFSDGSHRSQHHQSYSFQKLIDATKHITSDHTNRGITYLFSNGMLMARSVNAPGHYDPPYGTTQDTSGLGQASILRGMAAYNNTRKEFLCVTSANGSGSFSLRKYTGWDFDEYPSPTDAKANATLAFTYNIQTPNYPNNNQEANNNSKLLLRDDGQVHLYVMFGSSYFGCYYWPQPATDPGTTIDVTHGNTIANTTSYGYDQGAQFGQRIITSRDGKNYAFTAPYYYYWSGGTTFYSGMAETVNGASVGTTSQSSNYGLQVLPYKDDGFIEYYTGNAYAGNYNGAYLQFPVMPGGSNGKLEKYNSYYKYLHIFSGRSTTNYPGIAAVNDYSTFKYAPSGNNAPFNDQILQG